MPYYGRTRPTRGGIRARSKRGAVGEQAWTRRWLAFLAQNVDPGRLSRGRTYARNGQVLALEVEATSVAARVQGSSLTPYRVTLRFKALGDPELLAIREGLASAPVALARLQGGEFPAEVKALEVLFPEPKDFDYSCTCMDWVWMCKHAAAVFYLLAESIDHDPLLMFELRGIPRDSLVPLALEPRREEADPLGPEGFWGNEDLNFAPLPPTERSALDRLGPFPMWRGSQALATLLEHHYLQGARRARQLLADR